MLAPLFAISAVPVALQPLSLVGVPGSLLYCAFRDTLGNGTSLGKRWLGLQVIDLRTGAPCPGRRVWARDSPEGATLGDAQQEGTGLGLTLAKKLVEPRGPGVDVHLHAARSA